MDNQIKWYGLYIDGELQNIRKWYGRPSVRDFGVGELPSATYEIKVFPIIQVKGMKDYLDIEITL